MRIEHLEAKQFRNLEALSLNISPGFVLVEGQNAQGKTNLLEALYVCATGKSFRQSPPRELVQHGADSARLAALFTRHGVRHQIEVLIKGGRRQLRVDGRGLRKTSQLLELVNVVAFFPDDLRIVKGAPEERRRFIDRAVANYRPELIDASSAYEKALRSRNRILRDHDRPSQTLVEVYDEQLIKHGEVIHRCRRDVLGEIGGEAVSVFETLMGATLALTLSPGIPELDEGDYALSFRRALERSFVKDRSRGVTSIGPHRADLLVSVAEQEARSFASQGQQRASVLALKLAEVRLLAAKLDSAPILLLDDVSSELDRDRTRELFSAVEKLGSQVWISTTGATALPIPDDAQRIRVEHGSVSVL